MGARVLVVEDDGLAANEIRHTLINLGYEVPAVASSGQEAIRKVLELKPDLVLMDIVLNGGIDGVRTAEHLRSLLDVPIIFLSAYSDERTLQSAKVSGPYAYIIKPFNERELRTNIEIGLYRHQLEKKLRENEQMLAATMSAIGDVIVVTDNSGSIVFMNRAGELLLQCPVGQALGRDYRRIFAFVRPENIEAIYDPVLSVSSEGAFCSMPETLIRIVESGKAVAVDSRISPIKDSRDSVTGTVLLMRDREEMRLMQEELRQALDRATSEKAKAEAVIEAIGDGVSIQDTNYRLLYQNKVAREMFGDHIGDYCYSVFEQRGNVCENCPIAMTYADGKVHTIQRSNPTRTLHVEITASPVRDASGRIIAGIEVARDITGRILSEQALRESEERYRGLFENAHDMIQSVGNDGKFIFVNRAWLNVMKYTEDDLNRITIFDIIHPDCKDHCASVFQKVMSGSAADNVEAIFLSKDRRAVYVEGNVNVRMSGGKVIATQGIFRDVTYRRKVEEEKSRLEAQLRHSQKIEAIGTLTAGISHEFNNILTAIIGYGEFLQDGISSDSPMRVYVEMINSAAMRAANLTKGLLAYSRKQILNPRPVGLNTVVRGITKLISRIIGENITLNERLSGEDMIVMADSGQMEQVIVNLAANARDAMPSGGSLTIETRLFDMNDSFLSSHKFGKAGAYAYMSITDTGRGISNDVLERIFEPFFTTKALGKGTGLGLSIVYGIIKQHEGYIDVESEIGKGTTFHIFLPVVSRDIEETVLSEKPAEKGSGETVLVAEDDALVRRLVAQILEKSGYAVLTASDGAEAVMKFRDNIGSVDLVILDVIMPKQGGSDAYHDIKRISPDIKTIFLSGYATDALDEKNLGPKEVPFLQKPVTAGKLLNMVRTVLDS